MSSNAKSCILSRILQIFKRFAPYQISAIDLGALELYLTATDISSRHCSLSVFAQKSYLSHFAKVILMLLFKYSLRMNIVLNCKIFMVYSFGNNVCLLTQINGYQIKFISF